LVIFSLKPLDDLASSLKNLGQGTETKGNKNPKLHKGWFSLFQSSCLYLWSTILEVSHFHPLTTSMY